MSYEDVFEVWGTVTAETPTAWVLDNGTAVDKQDELLTWQWFTQTTTSFQASPDTESDQFVKRVHGMGAVRTWYCCCLPCLPPRRTLTVVPVW